MKIFSDLQYKLKVLILIICACVFISVIVLIVIVHTKETRPNIWEQLNMYGCMDDVIETWGEPITRDSYEHFDAISYPGYVMYFSKPGLQSARIEITDPNFFNKKLGFGIGTKRKVIERFARRNMVSPDANIYTVVTDYYWYGFEFSDDGVVTLIEVYAGP